MARTAAIYCVLPLRRHDPALCLNSTCCLSIVNILASGYNVVFAGSPREQRRTFAARVPAEPPAVQPGTVLYSNAGYAGAAEGAIRAVCGHPIERYAREAYLADTEARSTCARPGNPTGRGPSAGRV